MQKRVIIINGRGGVGKDTLCGIVQKHYDTMNVSSVDPIKKIARENGWNGEKDEKSRRFLAELKSLFADYNDLPTVYLVDCFQKFMDSDKEVFFAHIREGEEIEKFKKAVESRGIHPITLLIRGADDDHSLWNNAADDEVEKYDYDLIYSNIKILEEVETDFLNFFRNNF